MFLRFFKKPARIVCVFFEAFSGCSILLVLEMVSFLSIIFKLFFRGAGFADCLSTFFFPFLKSSNFSGSHYYQGIFFDQCRFNTLSQFILVACSQYSLQLVGLFSCCLFVFLESLKYLILLLMLVSAQK